MCPTGLCPAPGPSRLRGKHGQIGEPVSRLDGVLKVGGKARFVSEVKVDGMLYAALVHSTIARGRIASLDTTAAERSPGVALVMTYRNAPRMKKPKAFMEGGGVAGSNLPIMQDDTIHWNGETVALVLADTQEQADSAAALSPCTYDRDEAVTDFAVAKDHAHHPDSILGEPAEIKIGNAEKALARCRLQGRRALHHAAA